MLHRKPPDNAETHRHTQVAELWLQPRSGASNRYRVGRRRGRSVGGEGRQSADGAPSQAVRSWSKFCPAGAPSATEQPRISVR